MKNKISSAEKGKHANGPALERAFGPLWKYYSDSGVREIFVDAFDRASVERKGKLEAVPAPFRSGAAVAAMVKALAALPGSVSRRAGGLLELKLPDSSGVTYAEGAAYQAVVIRKLPAGKVGWAELIKFGCISEEGRKLFDRIMERMDSILIAGGNASGKTTFLNALVNGLPAGRRVVAIENRSALVLDHPACLCLDAASDEEFTNLLRSADRFSPDHLVVDSLDDIGLPEAVRAMRNGMAVMASCHAESVLDALKRVELMYLSSKTAFGLDAIRAMLTAGIKYISYQERAADGKRRIVDLSAIKGYEDGRYLIEPLLKYSYETASFGLTPAGRALLA